MVPLPVAEIPEDLERQIALEIGGVLSNHDDP
jgi:hypothetical protein